MVSEKQTFTVHYFINYYLFQAILFNLQKAVMPQLTQNEPIHPLACSEAEGHFVNIINMHIGGVGESSCV